MPYAGAAPVLRENHPRSIVKSKHSDKDAVMKTPKYTMRIVVALVVTLLILAAVYSDPKENALALRDWISSFGPWAPLIFILVHFLLTSASFPATPLTILGGVLFGYFWGIVVVMAAFTLGAAVHFKIARMLGRKKVETLVLKNSRLEELEHLLDRHKHLAVTISRIIPLMPVSLLNFAYGLTKLKFLPYLFWTFIGMLPGTSLFVTGAAAVVDVGIDSEIPWPVYVIWAVSGAIVLGATFSYWRDRKVERESECVVDDGQ